MLFIELLNILQDYNILYGRTIVV